MYLLDTHIFIWLLEENPSLPAKTVAALKEADALSVSLASFWEIAIKAKLQKSPTMNTLQETWNKAVARGIRVIPIEFSHLLRLQELPMHHRDPFDRLIIAQAQEERLTLVSHDAYFREYDVPLLHV
jgi:PIN domain nuclease of toxin-antitoxin system